MNSSATHSKSLANPVSKAFRAESPDYGSVQDAGRGNGVDASTGESSGQSIRQNNLRGSHLTTPIFGVLAAFAALALSLIAERLWPNQGTLLTLIQILVLAGGLSCVWFLVIRIHEQHIQPLNDLRAWSERIRAGDLSQHIPLPPHGEFANLIKDINLLTDELNILTEEMDFRVRAQTEHIANKTRSLEILYDIATNLSSAHGLEDLLEQFLDTLMTLVDARAASVRLLTGDGQTRLVASRGLDESVVEQERLVDIQRCLCGTISQRGGLGIQRGVDACNQFLSCQMVANGCSELVVVPLQYGDRILGVYNLFLDYPSSELGKDARDLLNSIGKHLGLAVEKARLDDNARRLAIMEERNMIGNELHDSLAQSLVSMRLQLKMLGEILFRRDVRGAQNEVRNLHSAVEEAHTSLRELLANFRSRIDERGLMHSIKELVERFDAETGIHTFFQNECQGKQLKLTPAQEMQIYRIVQEALTNVRKHSNAQNVRVRLSENRGHRCSVLIEDDGHGIEQLPEAGHPGEHIGLEIMRERAERINGELDIESEPGEGTRVYLLFPSDAVVSASEGHPSPDAERSITTDKE